MSQIVYEEGFTTDNSIPNIQNIRQRNADCEVRYLPHPKQET